MPPTPIPTVAQRAVELKGLRLPGAVLRHSGRTLHFKVGISPGAFGRLYQCLSRQSRNQTSNTMASPPQVR